MYILYSMVPVSGAANTHSNDKMFASIENSIECIEKNTTYYF